MKAALRPDRHRFVSIHLACMPLAFSLVLACSPASSGSGSGGKSGSGGASSGSGGSSSGGSTGSGGSGSGGSASGGSASGGSASGGSSSGGSGSGGSASGGSASGGSASGGSASGGSGSGGSASGGSASGGSASGGSASGGSGTGGGNSGGGGGSGSGGTGGGSTGACPANATFCSGFEDTALPAGAVYKLNGDPATPWTKDFVVDTTVFHAGKSSVRVKANNDSSASGSAYKMLAVPATSGAFWARFWIRSDVDMGNTDHNVFALGAIDDEAKKEGGVEFAEDVGIAFNSNDVVRWPDGYGRPAGGGANKPYVLAKMTWFCVEISYDGTKRVQQLFVNNAQLINATDYPSAALAMKFFKFGYFAVHGTARQLWYDDVAVAPTRIGGCPTQ